MSIYQYQRPEEFLRDVWEEKKKKNSLFTIRAWANQLGLKHHNSLHEMVKGKRKVPKSVLPGLLNSLKLSAHEGLYFELMVDLSRARSADEKTMYLDRMKAIAPVKAVKFTELESFRMLQNPLHFYISELALQSDFSPDAKWIQERLNYKVHLVEIEEVIERLLALDILREDAEGRIHRVDQFLQSKSDIHDKALKEFHKNIMALAADAIETQDVLVREFQGAALNLSTDRLPEAKKMIRAFVSEFMAKFDTPKAPNEEVYQLNLQFFGITKPKDNENEN